MAGERDVLERVRREPAVIDHYDRHFKLNLTADEKRDLVEFLKSL